MSLPAPCVNPACRAARRPRGTGFTLIELLVVVAVIGILASLLMPSILHAMKSASNAECQSNLHQIHAAMMNYANQYENLIVPLGNYPSLFPFFRGWHFTLAPYLRDMNVLKCPGMAKFAVGYGQNYRVIGGCSETLSLYRYAQPLNLVRVPSRSFIFCDWGYIINPDAPANDWVRGASPHTNFENTERSYARMPLDVLREGSARYYVSYESTPYRAFPAHPGHKSNCVFFDGHVQGFPTWDIVNDEYGEPDCLYDNQ